MYRLWMRERLGREVVSYVTEKCSFQNANQWPLGVSEKLRFWCQVPSASRLKNVFSRKEKSLYPLGLRSQHENANRDSMVFAAMIE